MSGREFPVVPVQDIDSTTVGLAIAELDRLTGMLAVSEESRQQAETLYREASDQGLLRGRTLEGIISACLSGRDCRAGPQRGLASRHYHAQVDAVRALFVRGQYTPTQPY